MISTQNTNLREASVCPLCLHYSTTDMPPNISPRRREIPESYVISCNECLPSKFQVNIDEQKSRLTRSEHKQG